MSLPGNRNGAIVASDPLAPVSHYKAWQQVVCSLSHCVEPGYCPVFWLADGFGEPGCTSQTPRPAARCLISQVTLPRVHFNFFDNIKY